MHIAWPKSMREREVVTVQSLSKGSEGGVSCVFLIRSSPEDTRRSSALEYLITVLLFDLLKFLLEDVRRREPGGLFRKAGLGFFTSLDPDSGWH